MLVAFGADIGDHSRTRNGQLLSNQHAKILTPTSQMLSQTRETVLSVKDQCPTRIHELKMLGVYLHVAIVASVLWSWMVKT